ncbi:MAG TPA: 6-phosphogluconolactonase [Rectinemataceae bacterium]|nr:6-phosphogluconolactonase [Rectinemataceae bacterium]
MKLLEFEDESAWIAAALHEVDDLIAEAEAEWRVGMRIGRTRLRLCLAGGSTPEPIYRALAGRPISAAELELWTGDERLVPPGDPGRNAAMIARAFGGAVWKTAPRLIPWPASPGSPEERSFDERLAQAERIAAEHEARLRFEMGDDPAFDLAFLGLGEDGHTASLFPGQGILAERKRLCAASVAPAEPRIRMSFTYPVLARVRRIRFLVRGPGKAAIARRLAAGDQALPAAGIEAADQAILYCATEAR